MRNIIDALLNGETLTEAEIKALAYDDFYEDQIDE